VSLNSVRKLLSCLKRIRVQVVNKAKPIREILSHNELLKVIKTFEDLNDYYSLDMSFIDFYGKYGKNNNTHVLENEMKPDQLHMKVLLEG
jgi:hypothetical protein